MSSTADQFFSAGVTIATQLTGPSTSAILPMVYLRTRFVLYPHVGVSRSICSCLVRGKVTEPGKDEMALTGMDIVDQLGLAGRHARLGVRRREVLYWPISG